MNRQELWALGLTGTLAGLVLFSTAALAVPGTTQIEGVLLSSGGGPAADGNYSVTLSYVDAGGAPLWTEGAQQIGDAKALLDNGTINAEEFAKLKAKALA